MSTCTSSYEERFFSIYWVKTALNSWKFREWQVGQRTISLRFFLHLDKVQVYRHFFFFIFSLIYSQSNLNLSFSASNTSKWISHVSLFLISIGRLLYRYTSPGIWGTGTCSLACSVFWFFRLGWSTAGNIPKSIMRTMNDGMIFYLSVAVEVVSIPPSMPSSEGFLQGRSTWPFS